MQVARFLVKTVARLGSGKNPGGTTTYMGNIEHLMQCKSSASSGNLASMSDALFFYEHNYFYLPLLLSCSQGLVKTFSRVGGI